MHKNKKAFTLVEMVITLLIIITLSLLSFPIYRGRTNKTSKLAEGYALLGSIISAQVSYYNEYKTFLCFLDAGFKGIAGFDAYTCNDTVLGINAINNRYFTSFNAYGINENRFTYKYRFKAIVRSKDAGTISLEYNKTQRFEPVVTGVK
ncbi:MAG: prepilin-type N-terminal cleavage/methylation domain-containing protein [Elusimicrobia bacterium]|nr:prepilin-type N-terminal cleavage/methylation domain-containing protein [Elusimicrobiota bacterium]